MSKTKQIQAAVTNQIVEALESGVKPWSMPWERQGTSIAPYNASTGHFYRGINMLVLLMNALKRGTSQFGYVTFNQARQKGWRIKKGSSGIKIFFYSKREVESKTEDGEREKVEIPFLRWSTVFNLVDVEIGDGEQPCTRPEVGDFLKDAQAYAKKTGLTILNGGDRAWYSFIPDTIAMPHRSQFSCDSVYAATLAHELTHSTNHPSRLDRRSWLKAKFKDDQERYAFEELVAELGAAFLGAQYGFGGEHQQHESYIASWLTHLKNDPTWIFKAASKASEAQGFIESSVFSDSSAEAA